jgi:type VI protein secretion system component VasF
MNKIQKQLTNSEIIERGQRASVLLNSESYLQCIEDMYSCLHLGFDGLQTDDADSAMAIVRQLRSLRTLNSKFETWSQESKRLTELEND